MSPFCRCGCPSYFQARSDSIFTFPRFVFARPAHTLFFNICGFGFWPNQSSITRTVCFSKCMSTGNKRHCFFIVHTHSAKRFANIFGSSHRIGVAIWPFGININKSHLNSSKWIFEFAIGCIAFVIQPFVFGAPVHMLFRFPNIFAASRKTECFKSHRFQSHVAC